MKRFLVVFLAGFFACAHPNPQPKEETTMQSTQDTTISNAALAFAKAADQRDASALEAILDPSFRVVFTVKGSSEVKTLDRATYLSLLEAGKVGGVPREAKVLRASSDGAIAHAAVLLTSEKARFESEYTLIKANDQWRLVQDATVFTPLQ